MPATVDHAIARDVPLQLRAIGTVRPFATLPIKSRVDGQIAKIAFVQGAKVNKGDLLVQIDPRPFEAARNQAAAILERDKALLENAEIEMRRTDELAGTRAVPASQIDANRARVANLRATVAADTAALELANLELSFCSIHAPISGRVGTKLVDEGAMVRNNDTVLVVINQTQPVYIDFAIPEQSLAQVKRAAEEGPLKVEITPSQPGAEALDGELAVINN
ncbi:MAG: efflux RND transporter periplasmic adaptor subunit, partial [Verrucomicrobiae bacterium]|nr:efflux RND transporter periplasmic adaptor subunit [Verrucomicrobiae bacterium]